MINSTIKSLNSDQSVSLLLNELKTVNGHFLLVADENWDSVNWADILNYSSCNVSIISNRYDIAKKAKAASISTYFNDLDFSGFKPKSFDGVFFRVSKERANTHHVINQSAYLLKSGAALMLSGEKNDGIKSYVKKASMLFNTSSIPIKFGNQYLAKISVSVPDDFKKLDDSNYSSMQAVKALSKYGLASKPGVFGWNKIDRGSAFFVDNLPILMSSFKHSPRTLLDLGCGYGFLCYQAKSFDIKNITATDNNAAALIAVKANFKNSEQRVEIVASNVGDVITKSFDTIWCNPPFHKGFLINSDLTSKFLEATCRLLASDGHAFYVVNSFIPLEKKAHGLFRSIQLVADNGSFKVIVLSNPQRNAIKQTPSAKIN
jgi:16S rRNA (guanine1207-N2)-methyltransferase